MRLGLAPRSMTLDDLEEKFNFFRNFVLGGVFVKNASEG